MTSTCYPSPTLCQADSSLSNWPMSLSLYTFSGSSVRFLWVFPSPKPAIYSCSNSVSRSFASCKQKQDVSVELIFFWNVLPEEIPRLLRILQLQPNLCQDTNEQFIHIVIDPYRRFYILAVVGRGDWFALCGRTRTERFNFIPTVWWNGKLGRMMV